MISAWLSNIWAKVVFVGVFVGLLLLGVLKLIATGRKVERAEQLQRQSDIRRKADEVERTVDRADDAERERLRNRWTR